MYVHPQLELGILYKMKKPNSRILTSMITWELVIQLRCGGSIMGEVMIIEIIIHTQFFHTVPILFHFVQFSVKGKVVEIYSVKSSGVKKDQNFIHIFLPARNTQKS